VIVAGRARVKGKALSVRQPWAWAIVQGLKTVENRTNRTSYRGRLLIHAGLKGDLRGWQFLDEMGFPLPVDPPTGGIIGVVDLVDCVEGYDSVWAQERCWHWLLANPRPLPFVAYKGRLGLFNVL
jgi:ASCH domain